MKEKFLPGLINENQNEINMKLNMNLNLLSSLNFQQNNNENNNVNLFSKNNLVNKEEEYNSGGSSKNSIYEFKNENLGYNKENEGKCNNVFYQNFSFNNNININNNYYNNQINYLFNFPLIFQLSETFNSLYNPLMFYQNNVKNLYNFCGFIKTNPPKQEFIQPIPEQKNVLLNSEQLKKINNNLFLNKKRKKNKIKFATKKIIINKNKIIQKENQILNSTQKNNILSQDKNKIKTFVIYKRSKYVFKKRKPKLVKIIDKSKLKFEHCKIEIKSKKMKKFHHLKKSKECFDDTIHLLKMIFVLEKILLKNVNNLNNDNFKIMSKLYKESLLDISSEFNNDD